ncbi:MAG: M3 family metallopeptidase [Bacteroidota bacterium]|nr:M3 family metallopeptidase [Bacteroidota bacterium]MDP4232970.1 M3 family metallopeptidase [Bacteroidota bacterium]MDP4242014.1 M3 family metallopeptidase [Bacteroidota bacterium]MDP4286917.1 M3 family metallopeptidase [Bacteroidota bacterium]
MSEVASALQSLTKQFLGHHTLSNDLFWETKMRLGSDPDKSQEQLTMADLAFQQFSEDPAWLRMLADLEAQTMDSRERNLVQSWQRMFRSSVIEDAAARAFSETLLKLEHEFQAKNAKYEWGYTDPKSGEFVRATSNELPTILTISDDEPTRKAAYHALLTYEQFVLDNGFLDIIRARNRMARMLDYEDFYEMQVQRSEGLSKQRIFELLEDFELKTRDAASRSVAALVRSHGESAREPWNFSHFRRGDLSKERDPYLPFESALERWVRSFSALGIRFRNAQLTLDLIDRHGKYENGFMHAPVPSFFDGQAWNAARINFCSHATPNQVGAGERGLQVLFHEGGHAAHYSNVTQPSPVFSMYPAPHSYPETQSMFLDRILHDADWLTRYAKSLSGETMPLDLIERGIRMEQPFEAVVIRRIPMVSYFEKAMYEMPEAELTRENILKLARDTEQRLMLINAGTMPMLSITHPLDTPAYTHGYLLAEMAVHQTREYFLSKYGYIVDNPKVGPELAKAYWEPGNAKAFFDMVNDLTGGPFSAEALIREVTRSVEDTIAKAKQDVEWLPTIPEFTGEPNLDAHVRVMHGTETICEFENGTFDGANDKFKMWIRKNYPRETKK